MDSPFTNLFRSDLPIHLPNTAPIASQADNKEDNEPTNSKTVVNLLQHSPTLENTPQHGNKDADSNKGPHTTNNHTQGYDEVNVDDEIEEDEPSEEKKASLLNNKIFIPGTQITLQTQEDIDKWIAERKKKWPTRKNVEEKQKKLEDQRKYENKRPHPDGSIEAGNSSGSSNKKGRRVCHFFQQHKKCKFGTKCKNLHEQGGNENQNNKQSNSNFHAIPESSASNVKMVNGFPVNIPQRFKSEFYQADPNSGTLFKMLVQKEQFENENETILQFLEYLNQNNLLDHNVNPRTGR